MMDAKQLDEIAALLMKDAHGHRYMHLREKLMPDLIASARREARLREALELISAARIGVGTMQSDADIARQALEESSAGELKSPRERTPVNSAEPAAGLVSVPIEPTEAVLKVLIQLHLKPTAP